MADSDVIQRGADTSGRPLYASRFMWRWWDAVCDELGFEPTVVQGAHMARAGGGAAASAGYHDRGGCFDLRVWDRTDAEVAETIRVLRRAGAGAWVRDKRHGMDPHIHFVLGADFDLAPGARFQWDEYVAGRNGLSNRGADYEDRPSPLVKDGRAWLQAHTEATRRAREAARQDRRDDAVADALTPAVRKARRAERPGLAERLAKIRARMRGKR